MGEEVKYLAAGVARGHTDCVQQMWKGNQKTWHRDRNEEQAGACVATEHTLPVPRHEMVVSSNQLMTKLIAS